MLKSRIVAVVSLLVFLLALLVVPAVFQQGNGHYAGDIINIGGEVENISATTLVRGSPPWEKTGGRMITYEGFVNFAKSLNTTVYLPTSLPKGFRLTAVWAETPYDKVKFPIILVYSDKGIKSYAAEEDTLGIEIRKVSPAPLQQYVEDGATPIYGKDGALIGVIFPNAYCPTCKVQKTLPLAIVRLGGLEYEITFNDINTLINIIHLMKPLK